MKFIKKILIPDKIGSIRNVYGFAWFPTKVNRLTTVWLESYHRVEIFYLPWAMTVADWFTYDTEANMVYVPWSRDEKWVVFRDNSIPPTPPAAMSDDELMEEFESHRNAKRLTLKKNVAKSLKMPLPKKKMNRYEFLAK